MEKENLDQLEKILNRVYSNIETEISQKWKSILVRVNDNWISLNDLLFWESGFMDSVKWKRVWNYFLWYTVEWKEQEIADFWIASEYHKIQLVLLQTDEQRLEYLLNNIEQ